MEKILLEFEAKHSALGSIITNVVLYEDRVVLYRKSSGVLAMNTKLPAETTIYYKDIQSIGFTDPGGFFSPGIGWIEIIGPNRSISAVEASGAFGNATQTVAAMDNPFCIIYSKNKKAMPDYYKKMKQIWEESIAKSNTNNANIANTPNQYESTLDKIQKLKTLLDMGAISQEEYDTKKAHLLKDI